MQTVPMRVDRWSDPAVSPDRKNLWAKIASEDGGSADIEIPLTQIGDAVCFLASVANQIVSEMQDQVEMPPQTAIHWAPIPVVGVGLGLGRGPGETILTIRLAGFELAFSLDGSKIAALGSDFARIAHMLSEGEGNQQ
jgi:hypothetical protein